MTDTPITWKTVRWLLARGVPTKMVPKMVALRVIDRQIAFYEEMPKDVVLWRPETGQLTSLYGRAFALGEENVFSAGVFACDNHLQVHHDPLEWLKDQGRGIVVLRWEFAFDMLRDAPRLAVPESLLPAYRKAMSPQLPELAVITKQRLAA